MLVADILAKAAGTCDFLVLRMNPVVVNLAVRYEA